MYETVVLQFVFGYEKTWRRVFIAVAMNTPRKRLLRTANLLTDTGTNYLLNFLLYVLSPLVLICCNSQV